MPFGRNKGDFTRQRGKDCKGEGERQRRPKWWLNLVGCPQTLSLGGGLEPEGASDLITSRKVSGNQRQAYGVPVSRQVRAGGGEENKPTLVFEKSSSLQPPPLVFFLVPEGV